MPLIKSKVNAFIIGSITVLSFSITSAIFTLLVPYWISKDIQTIIANPDSLQHPANLIALAALLLLLLLILSGIGAFWLYRFFSEAYFGRRGALRWALFGCMFAFLLTGINWLLGEHFWLVKVILQISSLLLAFFISRKLLPLNFPKAS